MLFNSLPFLAFFVVVTSLYFILPFKIRWFLLLAASCFFYMFFKPEFILIMLGTIVVDYIAGIKIEEAKNQHQRKIFLILSLIANIGVLVVFKYYNFLNESITGLLTIVGIDNPIPVLNMILPIGLSFHTFQAMSYTIEVYRGNQKAERHMGIYALYVMFYPQLVAGPIERPQNIISQLRTKHNFEYKNVSSGLKLMLWGMFKKVVIADRLAIGVDEVYNNLPEYSGIALIMATTFFAFQIYCDFSGYSDIAIGAARIMGISLMLNFNRPYSAASISEFWSKWHISLSTWFRDYLYIPLGGNRVKVSRLYFNLIFVFMVSGLWHGADWTYIIWGALHGFYLVFALATKEFSTRITSLSHNRIWLFLVKSCNILVVFCLVTFAWLFFRAESINDALYIVQNMPNLSGFSLHKDIYLNSGQDFFVVSILLITFMEIVQYTNSKYKQILFEHHSIVARWSFCALLVMMICTLGIYHKSSDFIYFQF